MQLLDGLGHAGQRGGHQRRKAHQLCPGAAHGLHNLFRRHIAAQVRHVIAVIFQNDLHDVLADVVNVALDRGHHDLAAARPGLPGLGNGVLHHFKGALGSGRRLKQLRQEQRALFKACAHAVQRRNQHLVHQLQRLLGLEHFPGSLGGFRLQALLHCRAQLGHMGRGSRRGCRAPGIPGDVIGALLIPVGQNAERRNRRHHLLQVRVDDGQIQPVHHSQGQKRRVQVRAAGQAEADVGNTQHRVYPQLFLAGFQGAERLHHILLLGAGRQGQAVDVNVLLGNTGRQRRLLNAPGHLHALFGLLGNAVFVQGQADHRRAVLFAERKNRVQHLLFAVHRVHDGLAVVHAQPTLQRVRLGAVQLQGQIHHRLNGLHRHFHHGRLIHAGQAHVYVQHLGSGVHLLHRLGQDVIHVAVPQCLLEALFSGGVDAFAHNGHVVHLNRLHRRAQPAARRYIAHGRGFASKALLQQADKLRRGAAAAAQHGDSQLLIGLHLAAIFLRRNVVAAAVCPGQAGIGLHKHRNLRPGRFAQGFGHGVDLRRTERAVDAHGVRSKAHRGGGKALHGAAGKASAVGLKRHGNHHRQAAVFLGRQQRRFHFVKVGHGFQHDHVRLVAAGAHDLRKILVGVLKVQGSGRLQQFAQGAYVQRHKRPGRLSRLAGTLQRSGHQLLHRVTGPLQLFRRCTEGIGIHNVAARFNVSGMNGGQQLRPGNGQQLRPFPQRQPGRLKHRAHAAVQKDILFPLKNITNLHRWFLVSDTRRYPLIHNGRSQLAAPSRDGSPRPKRPLRSFAGPSDNWRSRQGQWPAQYPARGTGPPEPAAASSHSPGNSGPSYTNGLWPAGFGYALPAHPPFGPPARWLLHPPPLQGQHRWRCTGAEGARPRPPA